AARVGRRAAAPARRAPAVQPGPRPVGQAAGGARPALLALGSVGPALGPRPVGGRGPPADEADAGGRRRPRAGPLQPPGRPTPATGGILSLAARSGAEDIDAAVAAAEAAQPLWAARTVEERGRVLRRVAQLLERDLEQVAQVVAEETGKSPKDARAETTGAIELGYFIAGEGRRFYGRTMPSAVPNRQAMTLRQPLGVAGLII